MSEGSVAFARWRRRTLPRVVVAILVTLVVVGAGSPVHAAPPDVVPPRRLDSTPVPYPPNAKGDATVTVTVVIDVTGKVTDVALREGVSPFAEATLAAVAHWRFRPAMKEDVPISARILAEVTFHAPPPPPVIPKLPEVVAPPKPQVPVTVSVRGEREEPGNIHIPRTETRFVPGAFGDPFRVVEALPGMAPWLSGLPYYYVRGAPPENVGYFIDGISIPILFHVGAGPSTIAPDLVDSVDLFPGGYPAMYGRYAGAVIAGTTTPPNEEQAHGDAGARIFDAHALVETPWDNHQGTVLAAARYSYTNLVTSAFAPNYQIGYWDYQFRISHRINEHDTLALFAFGAHDELQYLHQPTFNVDYERVDLRYDHPIAQGKLRVAGTFSYDNSLTALQTQQGGVGETAALRNYGGRIRAEFGQRVAENASVRAGGDFMIRRFTIDDAPDALNPNVIDSYSPHTDLEGGAYVDAIWRPLPSLEVVPGFRFDAYRSRGQVAFAPQPRLQTRLQVTSWLTWFSALGTAHQEATEEVFVPEKLPSNLSGNSYQFSEALETRLFWSTKLRITGFHSQLVANDDDGTEHVNGLEVFLHRSFSERLGAFISYTLSRATTTAHQLNGQSQPTAWETQRATWDRTHLFSAVVSYDLGKHWRIGARFFVESGRPWSQGCLTENCSASASRATASSPPTVYHVTGQLPPFYRLDGRLEKRWLFPGGQWIEASLECFNILDKSEPTGVDYSTKNGLSVTGQSPIILPSVGVEAAF